MQFGNSFQPFVPALVQIAVHPACISLQFVQFVTDQSDFHHQSVRESGQHILRGILREVQAGKPFVQHLGNITQKRGRQYFRLDRLVPRFEQLKQNLSRLLQMKHA